MSVHQELNRTGSTEERSDDTGGRRTTKKSCPCTHSKSFTKIRCGFFTVKINTAHNSKISVNKALLAVLREIGYGWTVKLLLTK